MYKDLASEKLPKNRSVRTLEMSESDDVSDDDFMESKRSVVINIHKLQNINKYILYLTQ